MWTMNLDGTDQHQLDGFPNGFNPRWSPDGSRLAMLEYDPSERASLPAELGHGIDNPLLRVLVVDVATGAATNTGQRVASDVNPASWTADGTALADQSLRRRGLITHHIDGLVAATDLQVPPLEPVRLVVGGFGCRDGDQDLAGRRGGRQPSRRVDDIAQRREVVDGSRRTGRPDVRLAGMHPGADRDRPVGDASGRPTAATSSIAASIAAPACSRPADSTEEQPDDLVADQLVDESVVAEDDLRADRGRTRRGRRETRLVACPRRSPSNRERRRTGG